LNEFFAGVEPRERNLSVVSVLHLAYFLWV